MSKTTEPHTRTLVLRHSLLTRLAHWTNALAMGILLMTGFQILNAHPALYWGQTGFEPAQAWFKISAVPAWLTLPGHSDLATGRRWHFFFAWILVVNGIIYLAAAVLTGHLARDLLPRWKELAPAHLAAQLRNRLRLRFPKGDEARHYDVLQKVAYLTVIFGLAPLIVLSGMTMSPALDAAMPWLVNLFAGRQSARSLHFISAILLLLFFFVHIAALVAAGVWNELRSMVTGRYELERPEGT